MKDKVNPHVLFIRVTENCNAGCFMCQFSTMRTAPYVATEKMEEIAKMAKEEGIKVIRFTGGEPLLHKDIDKFVKLIKDNGMKTSIITNGQLLRIKFDALVEAGLDQLITSLDAPTAEHHNALRKLPIAFNSIEETIRRIKSEKLNIVTRVNTVVSPFNFEEIAQMHRLLSSWNVDQWSIIPLKADVNPWPKIERSKIMKAYADFQKSVAEIKGPKLLGYSSQWAGRNDAEIEKYFTTGIPFTPQSQCSLVERVRFYVPSKDRLLPCNCVAWRVENAGIKTDCGISALKDGSLQPFVDYMKENGPKRCTGCEPLNAYFGEHPEIVKNDVFAV